MKILIKSERMTEVRVSFRHLPSMDRPFTSVLVVFEEQYGSQRTLYGRADLHPNDTYSKRIGRKIALARALKNYNLTRDERRQIWEGLFAKGMKK